MLRNMAVSLIMHERIQTYVAKAKELRPFVERIITRAKKGEHLLVRKDIHDRTAYKKLFDVLAQRYEERPGGYTQILRLGTRAGDKSKRSLVRLVT